MIEYRVVFFIEEHDLGRTNVTFHRINTGDHSPVFIPQFRRSRAENKTIQEHVESMLRDDVIEESASPWDSHFSC